VFEQMAQIFIGENPEQPAAARKTERELEVG